MTRPENEQSIRRAVASPSSGLLGQEHPVTGAPRPGDRESSQQPSGAGPSLTTETGERSCCIPSSWYLRVR